MAIPPPKRVLTLGDVPGAPGWLERLLGPINAFIQPVADALGRGLTFRENFAGEVRTVEVAPPDDWTSVTWANSWATNTAYVASAWRQSLDGRVHLRGVGARAAGVPAAATPFITGLPPAAGVETFAVQTDAGVGTADMGPSGILTYYSGGAARWPLTGLSYDAVDRTPLRWATPIDVRLGAKGAPFPGRPGQVLVLACRQRLEPTAPAVVQALDWTAHSLDDNTPALRIHRVWGLVPGVAYSLQLLILPE